MDGQTDNFWSGNLVSSSQGDINLHAFYHATLFIILCITPSKIEWWEISSTMWIRPRVWWSPWLELIGIECYTGFMDCRAKENFTALMLQSYIEATPRVVNPYDFSNKFAYLIVWFPSWRDFTSNWKKICKLWLLYTMVICIKASGSKRVVGGRRAGIGNASQAMQS